MSAVGTEALDLALKGATRCLIAAYGGIEAAGALVGAGRSALSNWQLAHEPATMPIRAVAMLERATAQPFVTRELARQVGQALMPVERRETDVMRALAACMTASGSMNGAWAAAMVDARIDARDRRAIAQALRLVMDSAAAALAVLEPVDIERRAA